MLVSRFPMTDRLQPLRSAWVWLFAWLVCSLGVSAWFFRPASTALDVDEIYWLGSAYYYDLAVTQHDWHHPDWQLLTALENPPVTKYVIGLGLALTGQRIESPSLLGGFYLLFERIPGAWGSGADYAKRAAVVERVPAAERERIRSGGQLWLEPRTLATARRTMLACALVASVFTLLLGREVGGWPAGLVASQLLLLHPTVVSAYNHVMADAVSLMFSTAAAWVACRLVKRAAEERAWSPRTSAGFVFGGAMLALACGAKMNSLVIVAAFGFAMLMATVQAALRRDYARAGVVLGTGLAALAFGLGLFIAINPAVISDVPAGLAAIVWESDRAAAVQAHFLSGQLTTLPQRLDAVARLTAFGLLGFAVLAVAAAWAAAAGREVERFLAGWWLVAAAAVVAWIPFERGRYVIPVVAPSVILLGWLATALISRSATRGRMRQVKGRP